MDMMREANALAAAGRSIIHLETGQPSTGAPQLVKDAAARALGADTLGYTEALGLPQLRARIARHYGEKHGIAIDPARVVATTGSSAGLMLAFLALTAPGGRIGMARPSYPCYRNIALALGMEPVEIACPAEDGFQPTLATLNSLNRPLDLLLVASPANPTGVVLPKDRLAEIAGWCKTADVPLVADEIYHGLTYTGAATTALEVSDDAIVLNGFSKYYSMTGWRLGWMIVPEKMIRQVECLAQNLYISPPSLSQHAAQAAFDATDELEANRGAMPPTGACCWTGSPAWGLRRSGVAGRRLLYLCSPAGCLARQRGAGPQDAARNRRGGDAGHRFRHGRRPPPHAFRLCRRDRRNRRSDPPAGAVAAVRVTLFRKTYDARVRLDIEGK